MRCPWCHNRELVEGDENDEGLFDLEEALAHIRRRRGVLGGVAISGGEPLLRPELPGIIGEIKKTGISVKLDTNGTLPEALERLLENPSTRPDYVAMDLKLAPRRYGELLAKKMAGDVLGRTLARSAMSLSTAGVPHEFRSLALPYQHFDEKDILELAPLVDEAPWYFAPFKAGNCLDERWNELPNTGMEAAARLAAIAKSLGKLGMVRGH